MKANLNRLLANASKEKPVERFFSGWGTGRTLAIVSWTMLLSVLISYVGLLARTAALDTSIFIVACIMLLGTCMFVLPLMLMIRAMQARLQYLLHGNSSTRPFTL